MGSVRTICLGEQTSHLYIGCNLSSSQKTWAVVPTKVGIKSEDYATMEHEGVTSPCSFFFLPFRAVTNHGPKDNPSPGRVSSKQILNGKESLSCTFPAGGLPSYTGVAQWRAPVSKTGGWGNRAFHPCQSLYDNGLGPYHLNRRWRLATQQGIYAAARCSPHIRAGGSRPPCGRADSHSVGQKSGGSYDLPRRYPAENYPHCDVLKR